MAFPEHHMIQEILAAYASRIAMAAPAPEDTPLPVIESFHIQLLTLTHQQLAWVHQEWCV